MARWWAGLAWPGLLALLVVEIIALSFRFDGETLRGQRGWLVALFVGSSRLVSVGIFIGILIGAFRYGAAPGDRGPDRPPIPTGAGHRSWPYLLGHLIAYAGLVRSTGWIFEGRALASHPIPGTLCWVSAFLATFGLWMLAALPMRGWVHLMRTRWRTLPMAGAAGVMVALIGSWAPALWPWFHGSTFRAARDVLRLCCADVVCLPDQYILGTSRFEVEISGECSGLEGMGLIVVFLGACFWWFRRELRFPRVLWLIPAGAALSWALNVLRIAALIVLGDRGWEVMAAGGFHSQAGWLAFIGLALGLTVLARRAPLFSRVVAADGDEGAPAANPTAAYLAPLLTLALVTMVTGALSPGDFDGLYAVRVVAGLAVLWHYRGEYVASWRAPSWDALAVGVAVFAIWTALEPAPAGGAATAIRDGLARLPRAWAAAWPIARGIGSVVVIPLAEELAFRGYLTRRLIARDFRAVPEGRFTWPSFLISSLLFGLLHRRRVAGTLAGMAYALAYYRRGKLGDAVLAHAITNLLITISALMTGEWSRWS